MHPDVHEESTQHSVLYQHQHSNHHAVPSSCGWLATRIKGNVGHERLCVMFESLQEHELAQGEIAGEEPAGAGQAAESSCCASCTCAGFAHGAFCLFSATAFFGLLVGLPVYMYLVKLPRLSCGAAV